MTNFLSGISFDGKIGVKLLNVKRGRKKGSEVITLGIEIGSNPVLATIEQFYNGRAVITKDQILWFEGFKVNIND